MPSRKKALPSPWTPQTRDAANKELEDAIQQLEEDKKDLMELIEQSKAFVAARLESKNERAAVLSMKQVIQNEALVEQKNQQIGELKKVSFEVWGSPTEVDVRAIIKKTLAVPPPKCTLQETEEVLHEAEECVRAITLNQKGSRAA